MRPSQVAVQVLVDRPFLISVIDIDSAGQPIAPDDRFFRWPSIRDVQPESITKVAMPSAAFIGVLVMIIKSSFESNL